MPTLNDQINVLKGKGVDASGIRDAMRDAYGVEPGDLADHLDDDVATIPAKLAAKKAAKPVVPSTPTAAPLPSPATPALDLPDETGKPTVAPEASKAKKFDPGPEHEVVFSPWQRTKGLAKGLAEAFEYQKLPYGGGIGSPLISAQKNVHAETKERLENDHWIMRGLTDASDFVSGVGLLALETVGPHLYEKIPDVVPPKDPRDRKPEVMRVLEEGRQKQLDLRDQAEEERARTFGKDLVAGAVGMAAELAEHPIDTARSRPVTSYFFAKPALKGLGKVGKAVATSEAVAPRLARVKQAAGDAAYKVAEPVGEAASKVITKVPMAPEVLNKIQDVASRISEWTEATALTWKRALADGYAMGDPQATAIVEAIARDPDAAASHINTQVKRVANKVRDQKIKPSDVVETELSKFQRAGQTPSVPFDPVKVESTGPSVPFDPIKFTRTAERLGDAGAFRQAKGPIGEAEPPPPMEQPLPLDLGPEAPPSTKPLPPVKGATAADVAAWEASKKPPILDPNLAAEIAEAESDLKIWQDALERARSAKSHAEPRVGTFGEPGWERSARKKAKIVPGPSAKDIAFAEEQVNVETARLDGLKHKASLAPIAPMPKPPKGQMSLGLEGEQGPPPKPVAPPEPTKAQKAWETYDDSVKGASPKLRTSNHPDIKAAVKAIADELDDIDPDTAKTLAQVEHHLLGALSEAAPTLLNAPKFRAAVTKTLMKKFPGVPEAVVTAALEDAAQQALGKENIPSFGWGGKVIPLDEIIKAEAVRHPKLRAHAMEAAGESLASDVAKQKYLKGIQAEQARTDLTPQELAKIEETISPERHAARQEAMSSNLPGVASENVVLEPLFMSSKVEAYALKLVNNKIAGKTTPLALPDWITKERLSSSLADVAKFYGDDAMKTTPGNMEIAQVAKQLQKELARFRPANIEGTNKPHMNPLAAQSLEMHEAARQAMNDPVVNAMTKAMKLNMTARNPATHVSNAASNTAMQILRRGDPTVPLKAMYQGLMYLRWENGKPFPKWMKFVGADDPRLFYEAVSKTGVIDSNVLSADIGKTMSNLDLGQYPGFKQLYEGVQTKLPGVGHIKVGMQPAYAFSDVLFKLEEGYNNWKTLQGWVGDLKPDQQFTAKASPRNTVKVTKLPDGKLRVSDTKGLETTLEADSPKLAKILARAAIEPAIGLFFDYGDLGLLGKWLKKSPFVGLKSPFYSYLANAIDIPGVKRGQMARVVDTPFEVTSNSSSINASQLAQGLALSARRAAVINGLVYQLGQTKNQELSKVFGYSSAEERMRLIHTMANPKYIESIAFEGWNFAKPSLSLARLLGGAFMDATRPTDMYRFKDPVTGQLGNDIDMRHVPPDQREHVAKIRGIYKKIDQGEVYSFAEALDLIGAAGDPILQTRDHIKETEEQGKTLDKEQVFQTLMSLLMTPLVAKGTNIGVGVLSKQRADMPFVTTRGKAINADPRLTIPKTVWALRQLSGIAWEAKKVSDLSPKNAGSYFYKMGKEFNASLKTSQRVKQAKTNKALARRTNDPILLAEAKAMAKEASLDKRMIKSEMRRGYKRYRALAKAAGFRMPVWADSEDAKAEETLIRKEVAEITETTPEDLDKAEEALLKEVMGKEASPEPDDDDDEGPDE